MRLRPFLLLGVAVLAAAGLLFQPVRVTGRSMLPALGEHEVRLTLPRWLGAPARDDLVLFREPDTDTVAVKRVAGLPGERVQLLGGDLFVDGHRRQRAVAGPADLVPLIDAAGAEIGRDFNVSAAAAGGDGWHHEQGRAFLRDAPLDGFRRDGRLVAGTRPAADLGLEADFELLEAASLIELVLVAGPVSFVLSLGEGQCGLWEDDRLRARAEIPLGVREGRLFLAKVDQLLYACLDGQPLFPPQPFEPIAATPLADSIDGPPFEQAGFGGRQVLIRHLRVGRDRFLDPAGTFACARELQLREDEYFLLGDNPVDSRDSRHYGPVPRERLLGRVGPRLWSGGRADG